MARTNTTSRTGHDRADLYQSITDKIITELEAGRVPWVQPWATSKASLDMPRNGKTGDRYSGINILILWDAAVANGFSTNTFLTFRQALALGGNVRKGEHGKTVVYAHLFTPDSERSRASEDGSAPGSIPFLKRYPVFPTDISETQTAELR